MRVKIPGEKFSARPGIKQFTVKIYLCVAIMCNTKCRMAYLILLYNQLLPQPDLIALPFGTDDTRAGIPNDFRSETCLPFLPVRRVERCQVPVLLGPFR